jgi:signal peptidase I
LLVNSALAADLPDPKLTPGAIDPNITQQNIKETVCQRGYTKTVRPPAYYTNRLKKQQIREYGYADTNPKDYEEDHLISLNIGGNPTDPKNLWPQPRNSQWNADRKDELEFELYKQVCRGAVPLEEARRAFATNWIEAYKRYVR